eukprot:6357764-Pyramimonas_sp.AAC.1
MIKELLNGKGLAVHKEAWGEGMENGLGLGIAATRPYTLRIQPKKMEQVVLATEAAVLEVALRPAAVASLVEHWTWTMMVFRP